MSQSHEFTLVSLNPLVCNYNPIWRLGLYPIIEADLSLVAKRSIENNFSTLIPFDSLDAEQICHFKEFLLTQKEKIHFQLCLSQIDHLRDLVKISNYPVQLWVHRNMTERELTFVRQYFTKLHAVFLLSSNVNIEAVLNLNLFKKVSFFMPQKFFLMTPMLDTEEAFEKYLLLKKQFSDVEISFVVFKNIEAHFSRKAFNFFKNPNLENFKFYLQEKNIFLYLYFVILRNLFRFGNKSNAC